MVYFPPLSQERPSTPPTSLIKNSTQTLYHILDLKFGYLALWHANIRTFIIYDIKIFNFYFFLSGSLKYKIFLISLFPPLHSSSVPPTLYYILTFWNFSCRNFTVYYNKNPKLRSHSQHSPFLLFHQHKFSYIICSRSVHLLYFPLSHDAKSRF